MIIETRPEGSFADSDPAGRGAWSVTTLSFLRKLAENSLVFAANMQSLMHQHDTDLLLGWPTSPLGVATNKGKPLTWMFSAE